MVGKIYDMVLTVKNLLDRIITGSRKPYNLLHHKNVYMEHKSSYDRWLWLSFQISLLMIRKLNGLPNTFLELSQLSLNQYS